MTLERKDFCIKQLLEDKKIKEIYNSIEYKDFEKIEKIEFIDKKCTNDNEKIVSFNILNNNNDILNEGEVTRIFYKNKEFRGRNGSGKVVFHDFFILKEEYKQKYNLARKIHEKEINIYNNNSIQQIHLNPMIDGVIAWAKLKYLYLHRESEMIISERFLTYLRDVKSIDHEEYERIEDIFYDEDDNFLANQWYKIDRDYFFTDGKDSFTEWFQFEPHSKINEVVLKMYKNLEEVA